MGRLIDADSLIKVLETYKFGAISNDAEREYVKETVLQFVKEQPTAYDVDAVVKELEEYKIKRSDDSVYGVGVLNGYVEAIDIVREGGVK